MVSPDETITELNSIPLVPSRIESVVRGETDLQTLRIAANASQHVLIYRIHSRPRAKNSGG
jgi:hypothetical protein